MDAARKEIDTCIERLSLPKDFSESLSFCGTSKEELGAYLADLPHSSPAELCNRLYRLLPEVAGLEVPMGRKLAMLDMVEPEAFDCVQRLIKKTAVTPATTKILSLSIAMLRYLAQGYKSVLVSALKFPASPPNLLIDSIYGAIDVLTHVLGICWESYIPLPKNIWLELHSLHRIARLKGLESVNIKSRTHTQGTEATIKAAYAKPLLMACTDPSRYAPQDIRRAMDYLTTTANLVEFVDNLQDGIFIIDTQSDQGPQYSFKIETSTKRHFRLRTARLVRHIDEKISSGTLNGLPHRLARDLCKYWSNEIRRRSDHISESKPVSLTLGLSHVHRQITGSKNAEDYFRSLKDIAQGKKSALSVMDFDKDEDRGKFLAKELKAGVGHTQDSAIEYTTEPSGNRLRSYKGMQVNHSERGACIEFDSTAEPVTPGELVAFQFDNSRQLHVGLIRWVRITPQLKRRVGIELINGTISPCVVSQVTKGSAGDHQHYPALVVEKDKKRSILVPTLAFKEYTSVVLSNPTGNRPVKLLSRVEETYHIGRFGLELASH
jgi:cyclic-di-GMP-binding protein